MEVTFDFYLNNEKARHFQLHAQELRTKFFEWLWTKPREWINETDPELIIRVYLTEGSEKGLASSFEEKQFLEIYDTLQPSLKICRG